MKDRLLRLPAVLDRTGLGRSTLYSLIKQGRFPSPIPLTERSVAWPETTVMAWVAGRIRSAKAEGDGDGHPTTTIRPSTRGRR